LARTGINPKKNSEIGELAKKVDVAIEQEKKINEDIHACMLWLIVAGISAASVAGFSIWKRRENRKKK
jgi:hypothetical protein